MAAGFLLLAAACGDKSGDTDTGGVVPLSAVLVDDDIQSAEVRRTLDYVLEAEATVTPTDLSGELDWRITERRDGADTSLCDASLALTGTALSGYCEGCDFAFEMDASISRESGDACQFFPQLHYTDDPIVVNPTLVFFSDYTLNYDGVLYTYTNDLRTGFAVDYTQYGYGYYPGPYYFFVAWDEGGYGTASLSPSGGGAQTLSWDWRYTYTELVSSQYNYCDQFPDNFDYTGFSGWSMGQAMYSSLDCRGALVDVWEVDLSAGDIFLATVDTISADSAFDPYFYLNGPDSCTLGSADDSIPCTFPPTEYSCPSARFEVEEDGTHSIAVGSYGSCTGSAAEYALYLGRLSQP